MSRVEFRVRPVVRYVVTRYTYSDPLPDGVQHQASKDCGGLDTLAEMDNEQFANEVASTMQYAAEERAKAWAEEVRYQAHVQMERDAHKA